jgi:hypothetical protein
MTVFISYSHADIEFVEKLTFALIRENVKTWRDEQRLLAGDRLTPQIEDAIDKASVFVIILSPPSLESVWVQRELERATKREAEGGLTIVPVTTGGDQAGAGFGDRLALDFSNDFDKALSELVTVITQAYRTAETSRATTADRFFTDHAIETRMTDGKLSIDIDIISFDTEERYSVLTQFAFVQDPGSPQTIADPAEVTETIDRLLRSCAEELSARPFRVRLNASDVYRTTFELSGDELLFTATCRARRLGEATRTSLVFNIGALLGLVCEARGITLAAT